MGRAYNESRGDGGLKGAGDLVGVLADTAASSPNIPNCFGDALLSAVAARRCARGTPLDAPRRTVLPRGPSLAGGRRRAPV